jgi:serine/threonine-protein kinase
MMPVVEAVNIVRQVCAGIAVAHNEKPPIIHRDIKPQNILVGYDGAGLRVRVSDFGLAKQANPLTLLVSARGTLNFKPPEAFENQDSPSADVWAIGTTLYLLLTDTLPYPEQDNRDVADAGRFGRPLRPASVYNMAVDPGLDAIMSRCLATKPEDRYQSALQLLGDLARWHPGRFATKSSAISSDNAKGSNSIFGKTPHSDAGVARRMIQDALAGSKNPGGLMRAADLLEEAINTAPELREQYGSQLKLWRRGVCM